MAGSATPRIVDDLNGGAGPGNVQGRVAVACSGGLDSMALLHAAVATAASERQGAERVWALHVHHGLNPAADAWLAHLESTCRRWRRAGKPVELLSRRLAGQPTAGESVEAWAREHRYAALVDMAREAGCTLVLLAHHRRDQAETFLLQALRSAGPPGLAAMPSERVIDGIVFARPWLQRPRQDIEAYARRHRLRSVDDPSNGDPRHVRSRLRTRLWPVLEAHFPGAEAALADAARWQAEAAALIAEVAAEDLRRCAVEPIGAAESKSALSRTAWLGLSPPRRSAVLRAWWRQIEASLSMDAALGERLMSEWPIARSGTRWPVRSEHGASNTRTNVAPIELRFYRDRLFIETPSIDMPNNERRQRPRQRSTTEPADPRTLQHAAPSPVQTLCIESPGSFRAAGWQGQWTVTPTADEGVALARLQRLRIAARQGAEQFQAGPNRPPRSLKKQFQAAGIAAWHRQAPLLFDGDALIHVPGLGLDARCWAAPGEQPMRIEWIADPVALLDPP